MNSPCFEYLFHKHSFRGANGIRGSKITITKADEKESRRRYKYGRDKMRLEDTTGRMNGRLLSGI